MHGRRDGLVQLRRECRVVDGRVEEVGAERGDVEQRVDAVLYARRPESARRAEISLREH